MNLVEINNKLLLVTKAEIVNEDIDTASWASAHIVRHPWHRWILSRYVEADKANSNQQYWSLDSLWDSVHTIRNSAMNINHIQENIVGTWAAGEIIYPTDTNSGTNPYVEALGVFWQARYYELYEEVAEAYNTGQLYTSMECSADSITCGGENGCGATFEYDGPFSASYCDHITARTAYRSFNNPVFHGGALIMPGTQPGWSGAWVKELSGLSSDQEKDFALNQIKEIDENLDSAQWEQMMWSLKMQVVQKNFSY